MRMTRIPVWPNFLLVCCLALPVIPVGADALPPGFAAARNGTGFVVDDRGRVVTSHHVAAGCHGLAMRRGNARVRASLVSVDREADLALLAPDGALPAIPVSFRSRPLAGTGERVVVAGFPREARASGWLKAASAEVTGPPDRAGRLRLSVPVEPGNSGGPVFDRAGQVIGVAAGTLRSGSTGLPVGNPGVAVGGEVVQGFLRRAGVAYRVGEGTALGIRRIADLARESTVLVECL